MLSTRIKLILLLLSLACRPASANTPEAGAGLVISGNTPVYTSAQPGHPLYKAVLALQRDMQKVFGKKCDIRPLTAIGSTGIVVLDDATDKLLKPVTGWEAHRIYTAIVGKQMQLILQGADTRGAIYAIYTFTEKILGVPPLWYFSSWQPIKKNSIPVPAAFRIDCPSPTVQYRAWFPNDMDLFTPWRKTSADNNELWLEAALRLKLNTIEWNDAERDYARPYSISSTTRMISDYGLINTTHHHSPVNASFSGWDDYWKKVRDTVPPELSLANQKYLEDFWRYNAACIVRNNIDMLWVIGFRGNGDHPFWFTFKDAPTSMKERGEVISRMMEKQRQIIVQATGNDHPSCRAIFYDELSDLLAGGYIHPPADSAFIWTYVAARRDHYPNEDIRRLDPNKNYRLGYYFNYQFTSTGSHLAAGEGPWKMEDNFRYVAGKTKQPIAFSVVNAGNLREFLFELSANAAMMWDFKTYNTDRYLQNYCAQYFGSRYVRKAAGLYKNFYKAYWTQRRPERGGITRQFLFQDLRYRRAIQEIAARFDKPYDPNPLTDIPAEQLPGRTYRLVPEDNAATNQVDAVINGATRSVAAFGAVTRAADSLYRQLNTAGKSFFSDNLRQPAHYMYHLNQCLLQLSKAYKTKDTNQKATYLQQALTALHQAEKALRVTEHGIFANWYAGDRIFGFQALYKTFAGIRSVATARNGRPNILLIMADDMGYSDIGCYGGEVHTPNIDRLAKEGIRFTSIYTNAWCSPSRASLLTGLYPQQAGMGVLADPRTGPEGPYQGYLNRNCVTLAEVFKSAGYATAISGKWHLGDSSPYWPARRGFDHAFGLISGASNYYDPTKDKSPTVNRKMARDTVRFFPPKEGFYMTDATTENALQVLNAQQQSDQPFFLYVAYTAPHWPLHASEKDIAKYKGVYDKGWDDVRHQRFARQQQLGIPGAPIPLSPRDPEVTAWDNLTPAQQKEMAFKMQIYAAQIDRMDQGIGQLLAKLEAIGQKDNTIVIFLSDNGGCAEGGPWGFDKRNNGLPPGGVDSYMSYGQSWANASNTPFRYYKKSLLEGGIASPFIVRWPTAIQQKRHGSVIPQVAHLTDIMPTLCDLTGASYPAAFSGKDILPVEGQSLAIPIQQGTTQTHQPIYWSLEERKAILKDSYKLTAPADDAPWQLFDLANDPVEAHDLAKEQPAKVKELAALWLAWANRVGVFKGKPKNHVE